MIRVFKTMLFWLLIAVLPVQGLASVMKASCGQAHHAISPMVGLPGMGTHSTVPHVHEGIDTVHHAHAVDKQVSGETSADQSISNSQPEAKSSYCSACAACCFGAVSPPASPLKTPEPDVSERAVPTLIPSLAGYIPPSLERPPRYFLA